MLGISNFLFFKNHFVKYLLAEKALNEEEYDKYEINCSVPRMNNGALDFDYETKDVVKLYQKE